MFRVSAIPLAVPMAAWAVRHPSPEARAVSRQPGQPGVDNIALNNYSTSTVVQPCRGRWKFSLSTVIATHPATLFSSCL